METTCYVYVYVYLSICLLILVINVYEVMKFAEMKPIRFKFIPILAIYVVLAPMAFLSLPLFGLYQKMVGQLLKIKHGSKFLGFFNGLDAMHTRSKFGISVINVLLVIECGKEENNEKVFETISQRIDKVLIHNDRKLPKFCSTLQNSMGYAYMLEKENITVASCVKKLKIKHRLCEEITKYQLIDIINEYSSEPFPCPNELMWDVHVGLQQVKWKTNKEKIYFPVLFRFHHGITDGVNVCKFLAGVFFDNVDKKGTDRSTVKASIPSTPLLQLIKVIAHWCTVYIFFPAMCYAFLIIKNQNLDNFSSNSTDYKQVQVGIATEDTQKYFMKIKKIIGKHPGATFVSVITTALSASLKNYYSKQNKSHPEYLTAIQMMHPEALSLLELQPGSLKINQINFRNEHNFMNTLIPFASHNEECLINRLNTIIKHLTFDQNSVIRKVTYQYLLSHYTFAPYPISEVMSAFVQYGVSISNIPGTRKITFGKNRLAVYDFIVFVPELKCVSATLTITTYERRLLFGISILSSLLSKPNDVQTILDNLYKQIDLMEKEIDAESY